MRADRFKVIQAVNEARPKPGQAAERLSLSVRRIAGGQHACVEGHCEAVMAFLDVCEHIENSITFIMLNVNQRARQHRSGA